MSQLLTINRNKWYRGKGGKQSRLLLADVRNVTTPTEPNPNAGKMCCLGFYCLSLGATRNEIEDKGFPSDLEGEHRHRPELQKALEWLVDYPSGDEERRVAYPEPQDEGDIWENVIGGTNDNDELSEEDREARLVELFALKGIAVTFTDDEAPQAA